MNIYSFRSASDAFDLEIALTLRGFEPNRRLINGWWHVMWRP
jgi:hypothetical protein